MDTTDPPLDPAEMCEMVGRLIFRGLPAPVTVSLRPGPPSVLVMPDDLALWVEAAGASPSTWEADENRGVEFYTTHASGFVVTANRPYIGRHLSERVYLPPRTTS